MTQPPDNSTVEDGRGPEGDPVSLQKRFAAITHRLERRAWWKKFVKGAKANGLAACLTFLAVFAGILASPFVPLDQIKGAVNQFLPAIDEDWRPAPFRRYEVSETSWRTPVYYRNCADARAAGAAPIRAGEPGYAPWLDADGDGIACEPYRPRWR